MDVEAAQPVAADPKDFAGLVACTRLAAGRASAEADGEVLADFAVVVGNNVGGVAIRRDTGGSAVCANGIQGYGRRGIPGRTA